MKIEQRGQETKKLLYIKFKTRLFSMKSLVETIINTGLSYNSKNSIKKVANYLTLNNHVGRVGNRYFVKYQPGEKRVRMVDINPIISTTTVNNGSLKSIKGITRIILNIKERNENYARHN